MRRFALRRSIRWTIGITLVLNLLFLIKDISDDIKEGAGFWHIGPELLIVLGTVVTAVLALLLAGRMKDSADQWQERTRAYTEGLSAEIDRQLALWNLSEAEQSITLLMLKGLSNKEIAEIRQTSEHTIKQQSSAVYRKSGLGSRSELGAFFLEDLLGPRA